MFKLVSLKLASLFNRRAGLKPCSKNGNQEETSKMEALYLFFCLAVCGGVTLVTSSTCRLGIFFCSLIILLNDVSFTANTLISYIWLFKKKDAMV